MNRFDKEIQDYIIKSRYFEKGEQITPEQYRGLSNNNQRNTVMVRINDDNVTEYYQKKFVDLNPDQIKILSQIKTEKAVQTIKRIAIAFAVLTGINLLIVLILFSKITALIK